MPSLLDDPYRPNTGLLGLEAPNIVPPDDRQVNQGDALAQVYQTVMDKVKRERQISAERGLWDDETGRPTTKGLLDAAHQYSDSILAGTTAPGAKPSPGLGLERWPERQQVGRLQNHTYSIKDPEGNNLGTLDTEFDPMMGELHIADIQARKGANTLGPAAIRQLREALLEHYPDAKTLSGYRTTGAGPDRETFQKLNPYQGRD